MAYLPSENIKESQGTGADPTITRSPPLSEEVSEISFLDVLIVFAKYKVLILGLPALMAVIAALYSFYLPNIYTATAKILPPQQTQSTASALLAQLGGLGALAGGQNPNGVYIAMLKSRTLADSMIERFKLRREDQQELLSKTRDSLAGKTRVISGLDGIITIEVDDEDSARAAELANGYVEELVKLTNVLAVTQASQRRLFFEQQFGHAKDELSSAEAAARQAMEKGGLIQVEGQGRAMLEASARLRGQITVKEVQIAAMRTFAAESNPELRFAQQELDAMRRELSRMEGATGSKPSPSGGNYSRGFDSQQLLRNVKYYETIYELLAKQYEMAKIDEAKDGAVIQVLDKAVAPDMKSKPRRRVIVQMASLVALMLAILIAIVRERFLMARKDPRHVEQLHEVKRYLRWR